MSNKKLFEVLKYIKNNDMCTIIDICNYTNVSKSHIYRLIDVCIDNALIHIRVNKNIKKFILIDKGIETLNVLHELKQLLGEDF